MNTSDDMPGESRERDSCVHGYVLDDGFLTIRWSGHPYEIALADIDTPKKMVRWIVHLGRKRWPEMTPQRLAHMTNAIAERFGWEIWR